MKFDRALLNDDTYLFLGYDKGQEIYCLRNMICVNIEGFLIANIDLLRVRKQSADSFNIKMLLQSIDNKVYQSSYISIENPNRTIYIKDESKEYILVLRNYIMRNNNLELLRKYE